MVKRLFDHLTLCILLQSIVIVICQTSERVFCKPRSGCGIDKCDPVVPGWDGADFDINAHLHRDEFPLTCQIENGDMSKLEKELESQKGKISIMEDFNIDLQKELKEVKESNKLLTKKLNSAQMKLNKMGKDFLRLERKLDEMGKRFEQTGDNEAMSTQRSITVDRGITPNNIDSEYCTLKIRDKCYWTRIEDVNFLRAKEICNDHGSEVAQIPDENTYSLILNELRQKIPTPLRRMKIWIGLEVNPKTGKLKPSLSFAKWQPGAPHTGNSVKEYTNVYIEVDRNKNHFQGVRNIPPVDSTHGVICQTIIQ